MKTGIKEVDERIELLKQYVEIYEVRKYEPLYHESAIEVLTEDIEDHEESDEIIKYLEDEGIVYLGTFQIGGKYVSYWLIAKHAIIETRTYGFALYCANCKERLGGWDRIPNIKTMKCPKCYFLNLVDEEEIKKALNL